MKNNDKKHWYTFIFFTKNKLNDHVFFAISQIISKGQVVASGEIPMMSSRRKTFSVPITTEMAPKARLIVHYVREDGEIVTDALTFNIDGTFKNKVNRYVKYLKGPTSKNSTLLMIKNPKCGIYKKKKRELFSFMWIKDCI